MYTGCTKNLIFILLILTGLHTLMNLPTSVISAIPELTREPTEDQHLPESSIRISPTPWPTANALLPEVREILLINSACILPCIAGLNVGESNIEDLNALVRQIDPTNSVSLFEYNDGGGSYVLFFSENGVWSTDFTYSSSNILDDIQTNIIRANEWLPESLFDLPNVIAQVGVPDDVFIAFAGPPLQVYLTLVYEEENFLMRYTILYDETLDSEKPMPVCFFSDFSVFVNVTTWIKSPDYTGQITDEIPGLGLEDNSRPRQSWSLETMTGLTEEQFAEVFRDNPQGCIYTLSRQELRDMGYEF